MNLSAIIKALWQQPQALAPSATGNDSVTMPQLARTVVLTVSPGAGSGAYVRDVYFPTANRLAGDVIHVRVKMPASANPTVNFRNNLVTGTILKTVVGTGTAFDVYWPFVFDGSVWS